MQLEQVERATKKTPKELQLSRSWQGSLLYLWEWFLEVTGPEALTFSELEAWNRMTCKDITSFEASVLMRLDKLKRNASHD